MLFQGPKTVGRIQAWSIPFSMMETERGHWWGAKRGGVAGSDEKGMAHHGKESGPYTEGNQIW